MLAVGLGTIHSKLGAVVFYFASLQLSKVEEAATGMKDSLTQIQREAGPGADERDAVGNVDDLRFIDTF